MQVVGDDSAENESGERRAGVLGHVSREQALVCLQNCPLLADMAEWSHWDVVFRPALKDLKDFIQKHGGVYQCTALGRQQSCLHILCCVHRANRHEAAINDAKKYGRY